MMLDSVDNILKKEREVGIDEELLLYCRDMVNDLPGGADFLPKSVRPISYLNHVIDILISDSEMTLRVKHQVLREPFLCQETTMKAISEIVANKVSSLLASNGAVESDRDIAMAIGLFCYRALAEPGVGTTISFRKLYVSSWAALRSKINEKRETHT